jgi:hypothetical protein
VTVAVESDWVAANQRHLTAAIALVGERLEDGDVASAADAVEESAAMLPAPSALDRVCAAFGLSPFERDVLLLCAGVELDATFGARGSGHADASRLWPSFGLALASLPEAHWSALAPAAPLRSWRLVELLGRDAVARCQVRIDERILHYLAGVTYLDERLAGLVESVAPPPDLPPSHRALAATLRDLWVDHRETLPQLCGGDLETRSAIAAWAAVELGADLWSIRVAEVPVGTDAREELGLLWAREALLAGRALLLEWDEHDAPDATRVALALADRAPGLTLLSAPDPLRPRRRAIVRLDVRRPTADEQLSLWRRALRDDGNTTNDHVDAVVAHFALGPHAIAAVAARTESGEELWDACRAQARPRLDDLAQRIEPTAERDELVLTERQHQLLDELVVQVRLRARVYGPWGFAAKSARGLGVSALFAGPSGTGKTMAAEVLARELRLDLYRIDLSSVVSKYIGETEKNLRRIFDAAEEGGAVLLFDEADALFGKRTEVRDSHDRYANVEVSYLLQRMEAYRGLAILTTNMKGALDSAFLRRLRFVVEFTFPDAAQRAEIWRRIFPRETPLDGLDPERLARLNVTGGNIRNIALGAAFLAADAGEPVRMRHLLRAARTELAKLERPATEAEIGGWA